VGRNGRQSPRPTTTAIDGGSRGRVDRIAETRDDDIDRIRIDDERRSKQHVIPFCPVNRTARRIDEQPTRHRFTLHTGVQLQGGFEWLLRRSILDKFEPHEKPSATDIPDIRMVAETLAETARQPIAHGADIFHEAVARDNLLHRKSGSAGHRMADIGVAVLEEAGTLGKGLENFSVEQNRAYWLIAAAQPFGD